MVKPKNIIFAILILFFLLFSFYPTIFELANSNKLIDQSREFILEHNYYWPDFNLYLSKIRQGYEGRFTALEKYTSERHKGSLIQEFYVISGLAGRFLSLDPNIAYLLGRIIFSVLLLLIIVKLVKYYFPTNNSNVLLASEERARPGSQLDSGQARMTSTNKIHHTSLWQIIAFLIVITSGSFPRLYTDTQGILQVGRYMEWWSNIDALQRITFIPHILFGQVVSFYLLYQISILHSPFSIKKFLFYILLGNAVGLVFPPSLIMLDGILLLSIFIILIKSKIKYQRSKSSAKLTDFNSKLGFDFFTLHFALDSKSVINSFFMIFTLPSILYFFFLTKMIPWSALVEFHKTHPMMIPFWEYIRGTGPIFFLGIGGAVISIINRDRKYQPLIFWVLTTFFFAILFTHVKEQSPLRFTQTGLFIPLGILGAYAFQEIWKFLENSKFKIQNSKLSPQMRDPAEAGQLKTQNLLALSEPDKIFEDRIRDLVPNTNKSNNKYDAKNDLKTTHYETFSPCEQKNFCLRARSTKIVFLLFLLFYLLTNLFMMKVSLDWQTNWITQRLRATIPPVPYPPQAMYPLKSWMDGIRYLRDNTNHNDVVLAEVTAGNYIPAYAGNTVYFGQANTVNYEEKQLQVDRFFKGEIPASQLQIFLKEGKIKYVFYSLQEKEMAPGKNLSNFYPDLFSSKPVFANEIVTIYKINNQ